MSDLPAGRELDALVAEKVMGLKVTPVRIGDTGKILVEAFVVAVSQDNSSFVHYTAKPVPGYSTDIAAAWEVVEKRASCNPKFARYVLPDRWVVIMDVAADRNAAVSAEEATLPLAVCRTALKAVGA